MCWMTVHFWLSPLGGSVTPWAAAGAAGAMTTRAARPNRALRRRIMDTPVERAAADAQISQAGPRRMPRAGVPDGPARSAGGPLAPCALIMRPDCRPAAGHPVNYL